MPFFAAASIGSIVTAWLYQLNKYAMNNVVYSQYSGSHADDDEVRAFKSAKDTFHAMKYTSVGVSQRAVCAACNASRLGRARQTHGNRA